ncbi:MAG TPA: hydrogenase maturation protease [Phototrophicaceae bacterium]|nr:hydrogenase maturation protease [Phototrophicaceae bacterium]
MSETGLKRPVLCIGIGNPFRGDDAAGLVAARALQSLVLPGVEIIEHNGDGAALLETWRGAAAVFLIDAVSSGNAPGTLYRLDVQHETVPAHFSGTSTHLLGLAEAVELSRVLGEFPPRLIIYGIEGQDFLMGLDLSPAVAAQLPTLIRQIETELRNL